MTRRDRIIGIVLGVLLGLGIVTAFVFVGSEDTIDAPGVSGSVPSKPEPQPPRPKRHEPKPPPKPAAPRVATVRVVGGAPPAGGPAHLDYPAGEDVRLRVVSDQTVDVELVGLGLSGTVQAGRPTLLAFRVRKPGNYPLILTASHIAIAQIRVGEPSAQ